MLSTQVKFQGLLRELFQFNCAELDFGIYRIMNHKRDVIERFITHDLPGIIAKELERGALADQSQAAKELEEVTRQIKETLGEYALDTSGNLVKHEETKVGQRYLSLKAKATSARSSEALEAAIYNHLYTFFSRYYQDGDFISKRRYSKRERYAIPYNGEEIYLYWANHDQYYVKTAEYFTDYSFAAPNGISVHFKLQAADVEQDNVKGEKRFFLPRLTEITWDEEARLLVIPFEFRPLTQQETIAYGKKNQQEAIIAKTLAEIPRQLSPKTATRALAALTAEKRMTNDGQTVSYLEHHLRQYTRRNTSDFFIHKDLKGFLSRELDFYLKNEVLNLDEMEAAGEERSESWFQMMRVIKAVGNQIIEFLHQIEEFQKMLWEKRKFITETQYCITIGNISEDFYHEIAACEAQWEEWKELLDIDDDKADLFTVDESKQEKRIAFLKAHSTLVLDTKHFAADFVDRLLSSFSDLDEMTDGLLVHSENWQALRLMTEKYKHRIHCAHIDPPYNTQTSGFLYKNEYQHSSWLAMMENRIGITLYLLFADGSFLCHIDENEFERLQLLFDRFSIPNAGTIAWDKRNPMNAGRGIATQHEYIIWRSAIETPIYLRNENIIAMLNVAFEIIKRHGGVTFEARSEYAAWIESNPDLSGGEKAYRYLDDEGRIYQSVSLRAPEPRTDPKFHIPLVHPITRKPCPTPPNGFSRTPERLQEMIQRGEILFGPDETTQPRQKVILTKHKRRQLSSVIQDGRKGKAYLEPMGLDFPYCHPVSLYEELLASATSSNGDIVVDHFAGSGTTGHALINLNREDGGRRMFIMVEMADFFDTVLLPRIKKVTFTPEWKDGKPKRMATEEEAERSPRIIKYIRLESYEDALNNMAFDDASQQAMQFDDYLLQYMLKWETRKSETLLNVEKLARPFHYKLHIHVDGQNREKLVDIPETFNYLLGLNVQTRRVYDDNGRRYLVYRGRIDHRNIAVIWRETAGWEQADYERDRQFVADQKLAEGADEVFVNGDSFISNARSLEPIFKARMFAPVEA